MSRRKKKVIIDELEMERYAAGGKSIGFYDGKVVFVPHTIPGDVAKVYLKKNKKDYAEGVLLEIVRPSSDRQDALCEHFGSCGGCQWQMMHYERQIQYKEQQVHDQMQKIGGVTELEIDEILTAPDIWRYRNKVEFSFSNKRYIPSEQLGDDKHSMYKDVLGFHAKGLFDKVVEIHDCHIQPQKGNEIRNYIHKYCLDRGLEYYDNKEHKGFLRNVMMRETLEGHVMVNLMISSGYPDQLDELLEHIQQFPGEIESIYYTINDKLNDSIYDLEPIHVFGEKYIVERLGDFLFKIGPKSFFQTNTSQAELLYRTAKDMLDLQGDEVLYDIYCGTGSIGIYMSDKVSKVIGVEIVDEAVEDAKINASLNNVQEKCSFYSGNAEKVCNSDFFESHGKPDVIVVDPPRAGLTPRLIEKLLDLGAPKLLYISCNPATQARDLKSLVEKYNIDKMQPIDLFPQTHHIENISLLTLK